MVRPRKKQPTTDAVEILHRRHFEGNPAMLDLLNQERVHADVAQKVYDLRTRAGLTQRQLAKLVGTSPSVISRLEDADYQGHSLTMLRRVAEAVGSRVEVNFTPPKAAAQVGLNASTKPSGVRKKRAASAKRPAKGP